jgi:hypothetical protein
MNRPRSPGLGMALPAPRRPAPGGGLAVLVVVTVLAALAAPHAKAVRGLVAGGLPTITVPTRPAPPPATRPPSGLNFTNAAGCRPAGDYTSPRLDRRVRKVLVAAAGRYQLRVSCLRSGHSWYVKGTRRVSNHSLWRAVDVDQVDGRPVSPSNTAARTLAVWIGQGRAGVQPSEVGSPWTFGGRPWFTDQGHQGHLHVGFAGPTRPGGGR